MLLSKKSSQQSADSEDIGRSVSTADAVFEVLDELHFDAGSSGTLNPGYTVP